MIASVICERSQKITQRMVDAGHMCESVDTKPCYGPYCGFHNEVDAFEYLGKFSNNYFDLLILHPPCTHLAVSGNKHYAGTALRDSAIEWTCALWILAITKSKRVCMENPMSVIFPYLRKLGADIQYIQPWMFGHGETKNTGLALFNLPRLLPENIVHGRKDRIHKMPPSSYRQRLRSETYDGIADAIVNQWSAL